MPTRWHAYYSVWPTTDPYGRAQAPYRFRAVCVDPPGHPMNAYSQGETLEEARADLIKNIRWLLDHSEMIEVE